MKDLVEIAKELKAIMGEKVILEGTIGRILFHPVFATTLYQVKKDDGNVIIEFNNHLKKMVANGKDRKEYTIAKEFAENNNYKFELKNYDMMLPKHKYGILF